MYLASCSTSILTHDILNPQPLTHNSPHTGKINCVTYNHTSRVLASAGDDSNIILSHADTFDRLGILDASPFVPSPVNSIAFTSKSDMLGCGALDGSVRVWDLRKKEVCAVFSHHTDSVTCCVWNHTDQQIVSSSLSGEILVHSLLTKVAVGNFKQKASAGIKVIQFSPFKKNFLGAGSENGSVYIWDMNSRSVSTQFPSYHNSPITGLAFSAVNHMLMCTAALDQRINFYDTQEKKLVKTIEVEAPLTCISFCSDGHTLAGGTLHGNILIYDLRMPGNAKNTLKGHEGKVVNWLEFAKTRESSSKGRPLRENSRESGRERENKEPIISKPEEIQPVITRFRTVEEIKLEAKMRVEQKRKERNRDEAKAEEIKLQPSSTLGINKASLEILDATKLRSINESIDSKSKTPDPAEIKGNMLRDSSPVRNLINNEERSLSFGGNNPTRELGSGPAISVNMTNDTENIRVRNENNIGSTMNEEIDSRRGNNLIQMVESRLDYQDDAISDLKEDIQNLHIEVIRQFAIQMNEIRSLLSEYSAQNSALLAENQALKDENDRLKKSSY